MSSLLGLLLLLLASLSLSLGYAVEIQDDSYERIPTHEVVVREGARLKLKVSRYQNRDAYLAHWYHNDRLITDNYRNCRATYGELVCPSMTPADAGRYDLWGHSRDNVRTRLATAIVQVEALPGIRRPLEPSAQVLIDTDEEPFEERDDCFCSGVTGRCRTARFLYRAQKVYNLTNAQGIRLPSGSTTDRYLSVPAAYFEKNLLSSYGGYFRFYAPDECWTERTKPCMVLVGKDDLRLGHVLPENNQSPWVYVPIRESSWAVLTNSTDPASAPVSKFSFMSVLSRLKAIYIRAPNDRQSTKRASDSQLTVDVASAQNSGLGWIGSVEECQCHPGYRGLSCEYCEPSYLRKYDAFSPNGLCLSAHDLWTMLKRVHNISDDS
ncbi:basement membrane-specific heparan sulfate proteoglycan core protein-like isoform X1 [Anopheles bellator]|uniref:basement membrane-specific heparan sulfate proteoglycan core protein-like isoform X1 n=1 Tax=Anopheles bellator TaxID=139047 RepID=UPI002648E3F8|nr:basement membrane-specific heparan sulfate proteoglycan core protein-like isoform X1 [Anopheles bellator]